jgi:hypothetical protein
MTSSGTAEQGDLEDFSPHPHPRISFAISTKIFNFDFKKLQQD